MKISRTILILTITLAAAGLLWAGVVIWKNFRGAGPALTQPVQNIADLIPPAGEIQNDSASQEIPPPASAETSAGKSENATNTPLKLPPGFRVSIFAKNLPGARVMALDMLGNMWVSRPNANVVTLLEIQSGRVANQNDTLVGLNHPHGLAFDPDEPLLLYIAEENKIVKIPLYTEGEYQKIVDLPSGGGHSTRTLLFTPDKKLLVSIGSSCNVCVERDARRSAIYSLNRDGTDFREFARGLRNSVFLTLHPETREIWATEMGRDLLGDNVPPDEVNVIREGKNYGWPYCYGKQIHDSSFDSSGARTDFCAATEPSKIDIQAHSAPLGLAFLSNANWPDFKNNLLVAYHGSWNRSVPTGYKIVRYKFDAAGNPSAPEDFITGWLSGGSALGRPVGILESPDGKIYISDDHAGVIYLVERIKE